MLIIKLYLNLNIFYYLSNNKQLFKKLSKKVQNFTNISSQTIK